MFLTQVIVDSMVVSETKVVGFFRNDNKVCKSWFSKSKKVLFFNGFHELGFWNKCFGYAKQIFISFTVGTVNSVDIDSFVEGFGN